MTNRQMRRIARYVKRNTDKIFGIKKVKVYYDGGTDDGNFISIDVYYKHKKEVTQTLYNYTRANFILPDEYYKEIQDNIENAIRKYYGSGSWTKIKRY